VQPVALVVVRKRKRLSPATDRDVPAALETGGDRFSSEAGCGSRASRAELGPVMQYEIGVLRTPGAGGVVIVDVVSTEGVSTRLVLNAEQAQKMGEAIIAGAAKASSSLITAEDQKIAPVGGLL
jgi:hypothetical protein